MANYNRPDMRQIHENLQNGTTYNHSAAPQRPNAAQISYGAGANQTTFPTPHNFLEIAPIPDLSRPIPQSMFPANDQLRMMAEAKGRGRSGSRHLCPSGSAFQAAPQYSPRSGGYPSLAHPFTGYASGLGLPRMYPGYQSYRQHTPDDMTLTQHPDGYPVAMGDRSRGGGNHVLDMLHRMCGKVNRSSVSNQPPLMTRGSPRSSERSGGEGHALAQGQSPKLGQSQSSGDESGSSSSAKASKKKPIHVGIENSIDLDPDSPGAPNLDLDQATEDIQLEQVNPSDFDRDLESYLDQFPITIDDSDENITEKECRKKVSNNKDSNKQTANVVVDFESQRSKKTKVQDVVPVDLDNEAEFSLDMNFSPCPVSPLYKHLTPQTSTLQSTSHEMSSGDSKAQSDSQKHQSAIPTTVLQDLNLDKTVSTNATLSPLEQDLIFMTGFCDEDMKTGNKSQKNYEKNNGFSDIITFSENETVSVTCCDFNEDNVKIADTHKAFWILANSLRHQQELCDVTFVVMNGEKQVKSFRAHRLVIASASDYWRRKFAQESRTIFLLNEQCVSVRGLEGLLDLLYGEKFTGSSLQLDSCLKAAKFLNFPSAFVYFRQLIDGRQRQGRKSNSPLVKYNAAKSVVGKNVDEFKQCCLTDNGSSPVRNMQTNENINDSDFESDDLVIDTSADLDTDCEGQSKVTDTSNRGSSPEIIGYTFGRKSVDENIGAKSNQQTPNRANQNPNAPKRSLSFKRKCYCCRKSVYCLRKERSGGKPSRVAIRIKPLVKRKIIKRVSYHKCQICFLTFYMQYLKRKEPKHKKR